MNLKRANMEPEMFHFELRMTFSKIEGYNLYSLQEPRQRYLLYTLWCNITCNQPIYRVLAAGPLRLGPTVGDLFWP